VSFPPPRPPPASPLPLAAPIPPGPYPPVVTVSRAGGGSRRPARNWRVFAVRYDMRCPEWSPVSPGELYATALEQAGFVDRAGLGSLVLSEHHGSPAGPPPSPLALRSRRAGATR